MRTRPKRANESTIFELISDISLSSLGLFLIFFVVYTLIFNSVSITQIQKSNNLNMVISKLNQEKSQLNQEKSQLMDQNQELTKKLDNANNLAENAEQEKQLAIERNLYTGYYVGEFERNLSRVRPQQDQDRNLEQPAHASLLHGRRQRPSPHQPLHPLQPASE